MEQEGKGIGVVVVMVVVAVAVAAALHLDANQRKIDSCFQRCATKKRGHIKGCEPIGQLFGRIFNVAGCTHGNLAA